MQTANRSLEPQPAPVPVHKLKMPYYARQTPNTVRARTAKTEVPASRGGENRKPKTENRKPEEDSEGRQDRPKAGLVLRLKFKY